MQNLKGKRLLLLGSSVWKDIIQKFAKEFEVKLIFAGLYPAPLDEIADESYRIDTTDANVMKPFIKEHNIDGIYMGGSEFIISSTCQYINQLGYPCYCTKEQWDLLQDKAKFKELCIKHGLPVVPRYEINKNNLEKSLPENVFPVITKPTDGSGSNGFSVCHNLEEFIKGYKKAETDSPTQSVICEKFVNNQGIVVFYSFTNGEMIYTLTEDKYPVKYEKQGSYVGGLFLCESEFASEFRNRYEEKIRSLFKSIDIKEGTIWIEVFKDHDNYYFNEVGYRHGGSYSFYTVDYMSGINQMYADLYYSLTGKSKLYGFTSLIPSHVNKNMKYCIYPIHMTAGVIADFEGVDKVKSWNNCVFFPISKNIGDHIKETGSWGQCVALLHFTYETIDECKATINKLHRTFKVLDNKGINLISQKLIL